MPRPEDVYKKEMLQQRREGRKRGEGGKLLALLERRRKDERGAGEKRNLLWDSLGTQRGGKGREREKKFFLSSLILSWFFLSATFILFSATTFFLSACVFLLLSSSSPLFLCQGPLLFFQDILPTFAFCIMNRMDPRRGLDHKRRKGIRGVLTPQKGVILQTCSNILVQQADIRYTTVHVYSYCMSQILCKQKLYCSKDKNAKMQNYIFFLLRWKKCNCSE